MKRLIACITLTLAAAGCGIDNNSSTGTEQSALTSSGQQLTLTVSSDDWNTLSTNAQNAQPPSGGFGIQQGPPQALIDACSGSSAGAACSATIDGQSISGTCTQPPFGSASLLCKPDSMPAGGCPGMGPGGFAGGVSGTLDGSTVRVMMVPLAAPHGGGSLIVGNKDQKYVLLPKGAENAPAGSPPAQILSHATSKTDVELYVDHGSGAADFGAYVKADMPADFTPPAAP